MEFNREFAAITVNLLMLCCVFFLILKRKNLEKHINYFIAAIGLLTAIEIYNYAQKLQHIDYNPSTLYIIGTNFFVFFLFLLYFQNILKTKKLRNIHLIIIVLFLSNYILSAIFINNFFTQFSFFSYFVEVILLMASIYLVLSQTFNSDKILVLSTYFPFWICISLLVIYLGILPLLIVSNTASKMMNLNVFFAILFSVNLVGYSILLIGIFQAKKV